MGREQQTEDISFLPPDWRTNREMWRKNKKVK